MNVEELVRRYLAGARVMQVATVGANRPWIASVYFVSDDNLNLYWLSWPERRHSQEIVENSAVAASIVIKNDLPVIGVQAAGNAEEVTDHAIVQTIMRSYVAKYDRGQGFYELFKQGKNHHRLYRLVTEHIVLFDEVNFTEPQTVRLSPE